MTVQRAYRVRCDEDGCGKHGTTGESPQEARAAAAADGWDVGPHREETRRGTLIHHDDYCPTHAERSK